MLEKKHQKRIRAATLADLDALVILENACFDIDRLSKRSFRHHILSGQSDLFVAMGGDSECIAYGLVLYHQGTRLARLYSLAVGPAARGQGLAKVMLNKLEQSAAGQERHYMRLEVARENATAISLYESCGYRIFGEYVDYYEDHTDALRMQKCIRKVRPTGIQRRAPWYPQVTEFTCGPAALIMAMASLKKRIKYSVELELDIWREATTIFMTSGHGGCHPFGLALAAKRRGFESSIWVNTDQALFVGGVRTQKKKQVMTRVHQHFLRQCRDQEITLNYQAMSLEQIRESLQKGQAVIILVSTYRLDSKKVPHWVMVTGMDDECLFVHDPDFDVAKQIALDCQYVPIALADFDKMAAFGALRLRAAVTISLV